MALACPAAGALRADEESDEQAAFAECAAAFRTNPGAYESALCFFEAAAASGAWEEAAQRLGELEARHPAVTWLTLVRAYVGWSRGDPGAESLYRQAAAGFAADGNLRGELLARSNLRTLLIRAGRVTEAGDQVRRVAAIGELTDDTHLQLRALIDQARHQTETGQDLTLAQVILLRARATLSGEHSYWLHRQVLNDLGLLNLHFGQYQEAVQQFRQMVDAARASGDLAGEALARFNLANATYEMQNELPRPGAHETARDLARQALRAAQQARDERVEAVAHRLLAEQLLHDLPRQAEAHLARCQAIASEISEPGLLSECLSTRASLIAGRHPGEARRLIAQAVALMEDHDDQTRLSHAWRHHMRISWQTLPFADAMADAERALDVFESLRDVQQDESGRSGVLSAWSRDYYWLSGRLLERAELESDPSLVALAFSVTERMRARALLEALYASQPATALDRGISGERQQVLEEIVALNRRLLGAPDPGSRQRILARLDALELREIELRHALAAARGAPAVASERATLDEVQSALAPGEVLLSFQIAPWQDAGNAFAGGAWLIAVSRDAVRTHRLPGRTELSDAVALLLGVLREGQTLPEAESALHARLLGRTLDGVSGGLRRFIVVADYPLHQFPLALLRPAVHRLPLGLRYELAFVPSATLWKHWRERPSGPAAPSALVLANPRVAGAGQQPAARWRAAGPDFASLGALPYAESEGRSVLDHLGRNSELLIREGASEAAVKTARLDAFGILHFAAHAVVDEHHPERSAVILAAGDDHEDGLLQVREITELPLDGQVVVLSSCRSATGTFVRGEGVQGLARAFLAAGASAVIGSLWPMRDDHATAFFKAFYRSLARGRSVIAAFHAAQTRLRQDGLPAEAWAGFQLLGDGNQLLVPAPRPLLARPGLLILLGIACLTAVSLLWRLRFVRRRSAVR